MLGGPQTRLVVDLEDTTFVDATAVHALVLAHDAASKLGASFEVLSNPAADRVLEVAGVAALFGLSSELVATG